MPSEKQKFLLPKTKGIQLQSFNRHSFSSPIQATRIEFYAYALVVFGAKISINLNTIILKKNQMSSGFIKFIKNYSLPKR